MAVAVRLWILVIMAVKIEMPSLQGGLIWTRFLLVL